LAIGRTGTSETNPPDNTDIETVPVGFRVENSEPTRPTNIGNCSGSYPIQSGIAIKNSDQEARVTGNAQKCKLKELHSHYMTKIPISFFSAKEPVNTDPTDLF
jgi:hypothetical protein